MNQDSKFLKFFKYIDQHGLEFTNSLVNGFLYASAGILFSLNKSIFWKIVDSKIVAIILVILGFIINIFFYFQQSKKSKSILELNNTNEKLQDKIQLLESQIQQINRNYSEIFNEHLASLFFKLGLKDTDRISMYKFQDDKFYIIGRYSSNPVLKVVRRRHYDSDQGLIAKAWQEGHYFLNSGIPDYSSKARSKKAICTFFNTIYKIDPETLENITMKSKSFYLKAFMDSRGIQRTSIIVIESEKNKAFEIEELEKVINDEESKLTAFIEKIDWNFPTLDNAQNTGF
ncbi:hypothetical protein QO200_16490 [Flavobacterium sp. Arc3]|uniref:hypothetical protein n=1 Tax=Flavobacterium sp. Arc3 TaxID=3046686 RepID=UPI00352D85DB